MSTKIEWCDETVNPFVGCTAGCSYCYAEKLHTKRHEAWKAGRWPNAPKQYFFLFTTLQFHADRLKIPMKWKTPKRIFLNSVSDIFDPGANRAAIDMVMAMVVLCRQHTFLILTKQAERMREYFSDPEAAERVACEMCALMGGGVRPKSVPRHLQAPWPPPNLHLGVTVTNQADADYRLPLLRKTPAALRFVSVEPMMDRVDLGLTCIKCGHYMDAECPGSASVCRMRPCLDWVICGGPTGKNSPPVYPPHVLNLRDQCKAVAVPFFFKGWGEWWPIAPVYEERECPDEPGVIDGDWPLEEVQKFEDAGREVIALEPGGHTPYWCKGSQYRVDHQPRSDAWYMARVGKRNMKAEIQGKEWKQLPRVPERDIAHWAGNPSNPIPVYKDEL